VFWHGQGNKSHVQSQTEVKIGDVCHKRGEYEQAIAHYSKAIEYDPGNAVAYVHRADAYTFIDHFEIGNVSLSGGQRSSCRQNLLFSTTRLPTIRPLWVNMGRREPFRNAITRHYSHIDFIVQISSDFSFAFPPSENTSSPSASRGGNVLAVRALPFT